MATREIPNSFIRLLSPASSIDNPVLTFAYMPESFSESKSASYESVAILGRAEPVRLYGSSSARVITLSLTFIAESDPLIDVMNKVDFCRSLVYPDYTGTHALPPQKVQLKIGQVLDTFCITTSIKVDYVGPWTTSDGTYFPYKAQVDLTFEEVLQTQQDYTNQINASR